MLPYARPNGCEHLFTAGRLAWPVLGRAVLAAVAWCVLGSRRLIVGRLLGHNAGPFGLRLSQDRRQPPATTLAPSAKIHRNCAGHCCWPCGKSWQFKRNSRGLNSPAEKRRLANLPGAVGSRLFGNRLCENTHNDGSRTGGNCASWPSGWTEIQEQDPRFSAPASIRSAARRSAPRVGPQIDPAGPYPIPTDGSSSRASRGIPVAPEQIVGRKRSTEIFYALSRRCRSPGRSFRSRRTPTMPRPCERRAQVRLVKLADNAK